MKHGQTTAESGWIATGASVRGASHERTGASNEDALRCMRLEGQAETLLLALADGHGSKRSYRSSRGAQYAVEATVNAAHGFFASPEPPVDGGDLSSALRDAFARDLLNRWRCLVRDDLEAHPLNTNGDDEAPFRTGDYLVYGSTCLCSVVTPAYIAHLQIGDGDILHVSPDGEVTRPLPADERHFANETSSLCSPDALETARIGVSPYAPDQAPALILAATDGYANSFRDDAGFLQVATDIWQLILEDGLEAVSGDLEDWLNEASERGSGDDISVGLLVRQSAIEKGAAR